MFLKDGKMFNIVDSHTIDGVQYPRNWFKDPSERTRFNIIEVEDPPVPDHRLYSYTRNEDGTYNTTPIPNALDKVKQDTMLSIDVEADRIINDVVGNKGLEYIEAEKQAREFYIAQYTGVPPSYVRQWADVKLQTVQWAADDILATAASWRQTQFVLRTNRLQFKENIRNASTIEQIDYLTKEWNTFVKLFRDSL